ncbi:hypothetical protein G7046_g5139 [Stylonectria norvegica]|nr:hypothetical protein G7046_g5139 [Stylonectria norvegica]
MPASRFTGRAKSCTRCRQAKLACDARKTLSGPCSRCKSRKLDCRLDANFKRVSTRRLAEEISDELHALRSAEVSGSSNGRLAPELGTAPSNEPVALAAERPETTALVTNVHGLADSWLHITSDDYASPCALGGIELEAETVIALFQSFDMFYHPHAAFLQPVTSLSGLRNRSPLLFWTIILVASRENDRFTTIYRQIVIEHEELLSPVLQRAIQSIETIHSLLLLCLWPVPQPHYFDNPAWNYVGLAVHAAIQLDCQSALQPGGESNGWQGFRCFQVGTIVAMFLGLPPTLSAPHHLRSIDSALSIAADLIPSWWQVLFRILKIINSVTETLSNTIDHALTFSVTQMFSEQLDELKRVNVDSWRLELELEWCNAKLHMFALALTTPSNATSGQTAQTQRQIRCQTILKQAFEVASSLVAQFRKIGQLCVSDLHPGGLLNFIPMLQFTSLFNATTFLFRFMAVYKSRSMAEESQCMALIMDAHKIFQSYPASRELTRAAIHIEALMEVLKQGAPIGMSELVVKTKLGASVMFDAIFHACRQRNLDPRTGRALAVGEWKTVNDVFAERLPEAPAQRSNAVEPDEYANSSMILDPQLMPSLNQSSHWWEEWDDYLDIFQIGDEQLDINLAEPIVDDGLNLDGPATS